MSNRNYWTGREIEGRLYGLDTLYIANDFKEYDSVSFRYHHVLIGTSLIEQMKSGKTEITWDKIHEQIRTDRKFFTLEVKPGQLKDIPQYIKLQCHILYWIDAEELEELKSTDSVKLSIRSHDMYVFTLHNGQRVTRNDYYHDKY